MIKNLFLPVIFMDQATLQNWISGLLAGDRLSLSKCITLVESEAPQHQAWKSFLMQTIENQKNESIRIAITGVPGAGKSTLIDQLGMHWVEKGNQVAVLAVDPTSGISQGSVLGDKTRMAELVKSKNAFIRPSPARQQLGGLAAYTYETILLCEAAGFNRILIETVGVGQSETVASHFSDCCLLLLVAGTGDDIQGMKKGILETADIVFVNKADGANEKTAKSFARELKSMAQLWPERRSGEQASVLAGSAFESISVAALCNFLEDFITKTKEMNSFHNQREHQQKKWFDSLWKTWLFQYIQDQKFVQLALENAHQQLGDGKPVFKVFENLKKEIEKTDR
jgi:LAO/AO transport system kinase